jgi:hypothetical protein
MSASSYLSSHLISILPSGRKGAARTPKVTPKRTKVNHKSKKEDEKPHVSQSLSEGDKDISTIRKSQKIKMEG